MRCSGAFLDRRGFAGVTVTWVLHTFRGQFKVDVGYGCGQGSSRLANWLDRKTLRHTRAGAGGWSYLAWEENVGV